MKMNFAKIGFVLLLRTVSVVSSCAKYEEGPSFTLLTKKMRLTGDWTVSEMTVDGQSQDISSINTTASINNDGTYTLTIEDNNSYSYQGAWSGGCAVGESLSFIPEFDYDSKNITCNLDR